MTGRMETKTHLIRRDMSLRVRHGGRAASMTRESKRQLQFVEHQTVETALEAWEEGKCRRGSDGGGASASASRGPRRGGRVAAGLGFTRHSVLSALGTRACPLAAAAGAVAQRGARAQARLRVPWGGSPGRARMARMARMLLPFRLRPSWVRATISPSEDPDPGPPDHLRNAAGTPQGLGPPHSVRGRRGPADVVAVFRFAHVAIERWGWVARGALAISSVWLSV